MRSEGHGEGDACGGIRSRWPALALIAAVLGPAALVGEASRPPAAAAADLPPPLEATATVPLETLAAALAAWVAQAMAEPLPAALPRIVFDRARIWRRCAPARSRRRRRRGRWRWWRSTTTVERAILLPEGWTGATPAEMSVLAHEMVHHLQNLDGRKFACPGEREAEAYAVQERWLAQFGTSLGEAFGLNRLTLFVLTRCGILTLRRYSQGRTWSRKEGAQCTWSIATSSLH